MLIIKNRIIFIQISLIKQKYLTVKCVVFLILKEIWKFKLKIINNINKFGQ